MHQGKNKRYNMKKKITVRRTTEIDQLVSNNLKLRRLLNGKTINEISNKIGVSTQQYCKYESGMNRISSGMLYNLSKTLHTNVDSFYLYEDGESYDCLTDNKAEVSTDKKEVFKLVNAYSKITDLSLRKKLLELIKGMS